LARVDEISIKGPDIRLFMHVNAIQSTLYP